MCVLKKELSFCTYLSLLLIWLRSSSYFYWIYLAYCLLDSIIVYPKDHKQRTVWICCQYMALGPVYWSCVL